MPILLGAACVTFLVHLGTYLTYVYYPLEMEEFRHRWGLI